MFSNVDGTLKVFFGQFPRQIKKMFCVFFMPTKQIELARNYRTIYVET